MEITDNELEKWVPMIGYESIYEVSNFGNVRSFPRWVINKMIKGKILTTLKDTLGYSTVGITLTDRRTKVKVHRLIALHFIENPNQKREVNHKDGDKANNHYTNLEWCTRSENIKHAWDTGLKIKKQGEKSSFSKLKNEDIINIRLLISSGLNNEQIAKKYNVYRSTIRDIKIGRKWGHIA